LPPPCSPTGKGERDTRERVPGRFRIRNNRNACEEGGRPGRPPVCGSARNRPLPSACRGCSRTRSSSRSMQIDTVLLSDSAIPGPGGFPFFPESPAHPPIKSRPMFIGSHWTGVHSIDAEVHRWDTRSARACGLEDKLPARVSLQGRSGSGRKPPRPLPFAGLLR
jgi:hypothetical protein